MVERMETSPSEGTADPKMEKIERNNMKIVTITIIALVILFLAAYIALHVNYNQKATGANITTIPVNNNSFNINKTNTVSKNSSTNLSSTTLNSNGNTMTASNIIVIKGSGNKSVAPPPVP